MALTDEKIQEIQVNLLEITKVWNLLKKRKRSYNSDHSL